MGIKNVFKKKELTEDEIRDHMTQRGITTKSSSSGPGFGGREEKFGAFKQYAQDRARAKPGMQPVNPYANLNNESSGNPYANGGGANGGNDQGGQGAGGQGGQNPYASGSASSKGSNPYGQGQGQGQAQAQGMNPYSQSSSNPYGQTSSRQSRQTGETSGTSSGKNPYEQRRSDPYAARTTRDSMQSSRAPVSRTSTRGRDFDEESLDLNAIPTNTSMYQTRKPREMDDETLDLNELPEEDDLNVEYDEELPQEQEVNSEDEEVEGIKQDIRFVKQESLASTRNTLRMAQEADASGTNTLGMLGSQSERLYNSEQNINLADTQSQIAEQKVKQIERLNRSIFIPASGNPFNKKSRLRMQENRLKTAKEQEKYLRDTNRKNMYESEQRIKQGITQNSTSSELHQKYQGQKDLSNAQRYQFENDSEDDEVEKELASNLDQIALYSKKLKNSAQTMGTEVESQNGRLRKIEEDADRLDINIHLNNTRLSNIR